VVGLLCLVVLAFLMAEFFIVFLLPRRVNRDPAAPAPSSAPQTPRRRPAARARRCRSSRRRPGWDSWPSRSGTCRRSTSVLPPGDRGLTPSRPRPARLALRGRCPRLLDQDADGPEGRVRGAVQPRSLGGQLTQVGNHFVGN